MCQKNKWPIPVYTTVMVSQLVPQSFRAVVTVVAAGKTVSSEPVEAHPKKEAERLAAARMVSMLG